MARHLCLLWLLFLLPDACLEIVSGCCLLCDLIFSCPSFVCQIHVSGGYRDLILASFENVAVLFVLLGI